MSELSRHLLCTETTSLSPLLCVLFYAWSLVLEHHLYKLIVIQLPVAILNKKKFVVFCMFFFSINLRNAYYINIRKYHHWYEVIFFEFGLRRTRPDPRQRMTVSGSDTKKKIDSDLNSQNYH